MTRWIDPQAVDISPLDALGLHPLAAQTLIRRGYVNPDLARAFLDPLHAPAVPASALPGTQAASERIHLAIQKGEPICVWGDFDVDGQTATTVLVQTLQALDANVIYYIPVRGRESHGVHVESLKPLIGQGIRLLLTCDTGITAHEAIDFANSQGVDVVITDHHDLGETLPHAKAIINPKQLPSEHPLASLAGVGVAYKLAEALLNESRTSDLENLLDLAALGLVADVALLKGECRSLVQRGIQSLRATDRLGLRALAELSGTDLENTTETTIGFTLAPRLNALGRLSDANPAVDFLLTRDPVRARVLAAQIEGLNVQRRLLSSQVYEAAEMQLAQSPALLNEPALVLSHRDWPGGVVGIVASHLVERYHKPAILLSEAGDGILRGSARSIEGLHITQAIAENKKLLLAFGGHPMAAGLSLPVDKLNEFRRGLSKAIEKQMGEVALEEPSLTIDAWLGLEQVNFELAEALEKLGPFGAGNPELNLATRDLTLKSIQEIGRTREHRRLVVEDGQGAKRELLWWNGAGEDMPDLDTKMDVVYSLRLGTYRGEKQLSLEFRELRVLQEKAVEIHRPKIEVRDLRHQPAGTPIPPSILVWAEGDHKDAGRNRFDLIPSDELEIYTAPASPADLQAVLELVKPRVVHWLAIPPAATNPEQFLERLAGLAKFAIRQHGGKTTLKELTAAMATRERALQIGMDWLAAGGHFSVAMEENQVTLTAGNGNPLQKNPYLQAELFVALRGILNEISAYRKYLAQLDDPARLINP